MTLPDGARNAGAPFDFKLDLRLLLFHFPLVLCGLCTCCCKARSIRLAKLGFGIPRSHLRNTSGPTMSDDGGDDFVG